MPFKIILRELVESTPGATGAILTDWEGEAVEQHCLYDDYELKVIAAHKGILLNRIKEIHASFPGGTPSGAVITTSSLHILTGYIGSEYALVMTLDKGAILGRALYRFRGALKVLEKEIY